MGRSLPPGDQPWQTFTVDVRVVRGQAAVRASVHTSYVTGVVGATGVRPRPLWEGPIAVRNADVPVTPEACALWAQAALEKAFPTLF